MDMILTHAGAVRKVFKATAAVRRQQAELRELSRLRRLQPAGLRSLEWREQFFEGRR